MWRKVMGKQCMCQENATPAGETAVNTTGMVSDLIKVCLLMQTGSLCSGNGKGEKQKTKPCSPSSPRDIRFTKDEL